MKPWFAPLVIAFALLSDAQAQDVKRDIPYGSHDRQVLDVYSPPGAKNLPVVFWIHGGGWQAGDKSDVQIKPKVFMEKGFVFVSTNYRLLPNVDMGTIVRDVAKSIRWVHDHIAEYGGDPNRLLVMGHSAGAQLAALVCTDDRYLKAEGLSLSIIKGCVPVDGDTYDVPAIIETAETRRRVHGQPQAKFGHREKFGNDPAKHRDFSAVTHVATGQGHPPVPDPARRRAPRHDRPGPAPRHRAEGRGRPRHASSAAGRPTTPRSTPTSACPTIPPRRRCSRSSTEP